MLHLNLWPRNSLHVKLKYVLLRLESESRDYERIKIRTISTCSNCLAKKKVDYEKHLPVYDFGKVNLDSKRLYVFGSAICIGLPFLIKPNKEKEQFQKMFAYKPVRNEFGYYNPVYDAAAGHGFTLLATKQHRDSSFYLFGCGMNNYSQLGFQSVRPNNPLELLLSFVPISLPVSGRPKILCLGAGRAHSLVSVKDEGLFSFGDNSKGQCGRFVIPDEQYFGSKIVHKIKLDTPDDIVNICCRFDLSICTTSTGQVFTFGYNSRGQLGRGRIVPGHWIPEQVTGDLQGEKVVSTASSGGSVLCVTETGNLFGWGCNEWGQVDPFNPGCTYYEPHHIKLSKRIGKVKCAAMGDCFSFILNEMGDVYVWGQGHSLGLGPETKYAKWPTLIPPPIFGRNEFSNDNHVSHISASNAFAAAVTSNGNLFTWGENNSACLGLRSQPPIQTFPLQVCLGAAVHKVALGIDHTIVLCKGGF